MLIKQVKTISGSALSALTAAANEFLSCIAAGSGVSVRIDPIPYERGADFRATITFLAESEQCEKN